jgi:hypothetical protein
MQFIQLTCRLIFPHIIKWSCPYAQLTRDNAMKTFGRVDVSWPHISWKWVASFTPWPLYPRYPLYRRLGGPHSQSGWRGERKILDRTGTRTLTPWSFSPLPVAILTAHIVITYEIIQRVYVHPGFQTMSQVSRAEDIFDTQTKHLSLAQPFYGTNNSHSQVWFFLYLICLLHTKYSLPLLINNCYRYGLKEIEAVQLHTTCINLL